MGKTSLEERLLVSVFNMLSIDIHGRSYPVEGVKSNATTLPLTLESALGIPFQTVIQSQGSGVMTRGSYGLSLERGSP